MDQIQQGSEYCITGTSDQYQISLSVTLQYGSDVHRKFSVLTVLLLFLAFVMRFSVIQDFGWASVFFVSAVTSGIYYLKRIKRVVTLTDDRVCEKSFGRERSWMYSEIIEITDTVATHHGSTPSRRIVLEHASTHDISIDDQMTGFDKAMAVIQKNWAHKLAKRIEKKQVQFFILKYW